MDDDKRRELDEQEREYVDDVAPPPAMNADPAAADPDQGDPTGSPEPTES